MNTPNSGSSPNRFRIIVNGEEASLEQAQVAVVELWAIFSLDPSFELVLEEDGGAPDRILGADDILDLDPNHPLNLFSRPPTSFG
ncbi:MAG: hypothetical protein EOP84_07095 [Verrucomicrobiaceae bacterium]|nr:MAG: hypothetical protein EOP84_07095 [Verrucomicrobiaceae bacterium]